MGIPVVSKALNSVSGQYSPEDYSILQLVAEHGETDRSNPMAVGAYALFQVYTGSLGYWTYEGNTPFMGLENLKPLRDFVSAFDWPEFDNALRLVSEGLENYSEAQLTKYSNFTLESDVHSEIDSITFPQSITDLIRNDAEVEQFKMFRKACLFLESAIEFIEFEDGASLREWKSKQG